VCGCCGGGGCFWGTGGLAGAATEIGGEEDSGDCERRVERMERSEIIDLG
jgi:hypothetical protein